ncbi:hypothetical protein DMB44_04890 [Thermoplasma sp. Kam2015]|uniref:glycerol-3-phosphate dehydrogenase/oxidase n=1 Tax=Thermoplasma sp. Kam2015 TaxID=2094122 RepID=UPI000D97E317|nr:glycerol-3-phosphate dehydrogenase/oxidase [Thermoplasma sp. Kam2015]PYB68246.1 hypothetical protein DMB44_04890 [Thermoplasma sp. Kam2015]
MNKQILEYRAKAVSMMKQGVDVLIIGGGITGSGIFNALSNSGLKVALVEARDFASGTSSRSSKLIHGGLRYIANGQFSVVMDSVRERDFLIGHTDLVGRKNFLIPIDANSWSRNTLRFGLWLYSFFSKEIKAKWYSREELSAEYPFLVHTPQMGGYVYAEGVVNDARLVVDNILSSIGERSWAINYAEIRSINFDCERASSAIVVDKLTGDRFEVPFRFLVNSAGPWVGDIFRMMSDHYPELEEAAKLIKLSKGDHIIIKKDLFPVDIAIALRSPIDGRQVFIIPRGDVSIIGTTEKEYDGDPAMVSPEEEDVKYLIDSVKGYVPGLKRSDVINAYSGLRPLFGKGDPGKISREYRIIKAGNTVNVVGGKLTTYRTIAIKISREILREFDVKAEPAISLKYRRRIDDVKDEIIRQYGQMDDDEISYAYDILYEGAIHADDILWRREGHFIFSEDSGRSKIERCIDVMKRINGISEDEAEREKINYLNLIYR